MAPECLIVWWAKEVGRDSTETNDGHRFVVSIWGDHFTSCAIPMRVALFEVKCDEDDMLVCHHDWHGSANGRLRKFGKRLNRIAVIYGISSSG